MKSVRAFDFFKRLLEIYLNHKIRNTEDTKMMTWFSSILEGLKIYGAIAPTVAAILVIWALASKKLNIVSFFADQLAVFLLQSGQVYTSFLYWIVELLPRVYFLLLSLIMPHTVSINVFST